MAHHQDLQGSCDGTEGFSGMPVLGVSCHCGTTPASLAWLPGWGQQTQGVRPAVDWVISCMAKSVPRILHDYHVHTLARDCFS